MAKIRKSARVNSRAFSVQGGKSKQIANMVQCKLCGMLALRNKDSRILETASDDFRATLNLPPSQDRYLSPHPLCAASREHFSERSNELRQQFDSERSCDAFQRWFPALMTPKEHVEMGLLAEQRRWQSEQVAESEARHQQGLELADKRHEANEQKADERHHESLRIAKSGAYLAAITAVVGAIVGAVATFAGSWLNSR